MKKQAGAASTAEPPAKASSSRANKTLLVLLAAMLALNVHQQRIIVSNSLRANDDDADDDQRRYDDNDEDGIEEGEDDDEADLIVRRSYARSYAHIRPCTPDAPEKKECMKLTWDYLDKAEAGGNANAINNATADTADGPPDSVPWWFRTLLRDVQSNGAYGFWHHFYTTQPPLNFCTIGKVATTEWRHVFCKLNADECKDGGCGKNGCNWRTEREMPGDAPWAVFLRDPLER